MAVFCAVPANRHKALAQLVVTLFGKAGVQLSLADKVGIVKKPEIQVLLKSYAVPQARIQSQASLSKLQ